MNLEYMKVSLFEISYQKKRTISRYSNFLRCTCKLQELGCAKHFSTYLLHILHVKVYVNFGFMKHFVKVVLEVVT